MDKANIPFGPSDLNRRTEEQAAQIQSVLKAIKPVQTRLLGEQTLTAISRGATFDTIEGGRHLNFMEAIGLLSNIASLIQIAILVLCNFSS